MANRCGGVACRTGRGGWARYVWTDHATGQEADVWLCFECWNEWWAAHGPRVDSGEITLTVVAEAGTSRWEGGKRTEVRCG